MRKIKDIRKEVSHFIEECNQRHKIKLNAEVVKLDNHFEIQIFEEVNKHHFCQTPPLQIKSIPSEEFLKLKHEDIKKLITEVVEEYDEPPPPKAGIH